MSTSSGWVSWAILSACFAALTAVFARVGVQDVDADLATFIRTVLIVLALGPLVWFTGKWANPLTLSSRTLLFLALSALATGASWICYFRALKLGTVAQVAPVDKFSVVLAAMFAYFLLGERPSPRTWIGIALVTIGILILVIQPASSNRS